MRVADAIMDELALAGVSHVYFLPGGGAMYLVDALAKETRISPIAMLHEQSAGVAAEAHAQFRNSPGVTLVTSGPGGTNAITATAAAWLDSTPMLFISGQVKTSDLSESRGTRQLGYQEIDIINLVRPITKMAVRLLDPELTRGTVRRLLEVSQAERPGPVWLDVPLDVQAKVLTDSAAATKQHVSFRTTYDQLRAEESDRASELVVGLLEESERPLFLLGNGLRSGGSPQVLVEFLQAKGLPTAVTWKALDLISYDDPIFAGRPGAIAERWSNFVLQSCDLLVAVGCRLDWGQLGYRQDTLSPKARLVIVDVDKAELEKFRFGMRASAFQADAGEFASRLIKLGNSIPGGAFAAWIRRIQEWKSRFADHPECEADWSWDDGVSQYSLVSVLAEAMSEGDILVPGSSGACSEVVMQSFRNKQRQRVFNTEGLGPMGFGIPAAIGACVASGGRRVICLDGDGGFALNLQELASVRRLDLPISFFILDNDGYESIRKTAENYFEGRKLGCDQDSGLLLPDYSSIESLFDITTQVVSHRKELQSAVAKSLNNSGPSVTIVKIGKQSSTSPRVYTTFDSDGVPQTSPLHDMKPLIDNLDPEWEIYAPLA